MVSLKCIVIVSFCFLFMTVSCTKSSSPANPVVIPPDFKLNYGDSILYRQNQAADYIVSPVGNTLTGTYTGFPEGIEIDTRTGAINVTKSETGLRYRITFSPDVGTDSVSTIIVLSGINFLDGFYKLTTPDSILRPLYNASSGKPVPGAGGASIFDEGSGCNNAGCNVNVGDGTINLAQTVRNGVFGATPTNNDRHEFTMNYRIDDNSGKASNALNVKLYFFNTMGDVTPEVYDIISSRQGTILQYNAFNNMPIVTASMNGPAIIVSPNGANGVGGILKPAKPRPPCIFIIAK